MAKRKISVALHYQILIALVLGGFFGYLFPDQARFTNWIGDVFLRGLSMVIIPLILLSISTGVASVGTAENLGRLGAKTMGYYLFSTFIAIITGLLLVQTIKPGAGAELGLQGGEDFGQGHALLLRLLHRVGRVRHLRSPCGGRGVMPPSPVAGAADASAVERGEPADRASDASRRRGGALRRSRATEAVCDVARAGAGRVFGGAAGGKMKRIILQRNAGKGTFRTQVNGDDERRARRRRLLGSVRDIGMTCRRRTGHGQHPARA